MTSATNGHHHHHGSHIIYVDTTPLLSQREPYVEVSEDGDQDWETKGVRGPVCTDGDGVGRTGDILFSGFRSHTQWFSDLESTHDTISGAVTDII